MTNEKFAIRTPSARKQYDRLNVVIWNMELIPRLLLRHMNRMWGCVRVKFVIKSQFLFNHTVVVQEGLKKKN